MEIHYIYIIIYKYIMCVDGSKKYAHLFFLDLFCINKHHNSLRE
jgi:hypothetical protein